MKIKGMQIAKPKPLDIVIPRGEGEAIILKAQAVLDDSEFNKLCPVPTPPKTTFRSGKVEIDVNSPKYQAALDRYSQRKIAWLIIKSVNATPDLEWEKVDVNKPDTWELLFEELADSGFLQAEINHIVQGVMEANAMDEEKFKEARESFTASQAAVA